MRIEGHRHRRAAMLGGAAPDALDDLEMSAVKAVEVAEREHGMHEPRRARVIWKMQNLHAATTIVDLDIQHEAIICQLNAVGQARVGGLACGRSCVMCVKYARRGAMRSTTATASPSVKCVSCGSSRSASSTRTSTPSTSGHDSSGMRVAIGQVGEVAEAEAENRAASRATSGTGTTLTPRMKNGAVIVVGRQLRDAAADLQRTLEAYENCPPDRVPRLARSRSTGSACPAAR